MTRPTHLRPMAAAVACSALLLSGCSGEKQAASPTSSSPTTASASPVESVEPATTSPTPEEPTGSPDLIYASNSTLNGLALTWRGGVVGTAVINGGSAQVVAWAPGMTEVVTCNLSLWNADEYAPGDTVARSGIDVMATTNDGTAAVAVLYAATKQASGLDAEVTSIYTQALDPASCSLGERFEVVSKVPEGLIVAAPKFIGATADVLAIAPYSSLNRDLPDTPALLGYSPSQGKIVWSRAFSGHQIEVREQYLEATQNNQSVFDLGVQDSSETLATQVRTLVSVETGKDVAEASDFEAPTGDLGSRFVFTDTRGFDGYEKQFISDGSSSSVLKGGTMSPEAVVAYDGNGKRVLVGFYCADDADDCSISEYGRALGYLTEGGTIHEVLPASKVDDLQLRFHGASNGVLYVETTSESLTIGLDGTQIGNANEFPYYPVSEISNGDEIWTLWKTDSGFMSNGEDYAITQGGAQPQAEHLNG